MSDFTAGECIWNGYDKQVDILLFYALLLVTAAAFCIARFVLNKKNAGVSANASTGKDARVFWENNKRAAFIINMLQMFLPLAFLAFYSFHYEYSSSPEGGAADNIILFYSGRWKWACIILCTVFVLAQYYSGFIKKEAGIHLLTFPVIAAIGSMHTPEGIMSVDFFHNGETALPMQQLLSFGKLPYNGLDPIHGLCDYYYSLINLIFFDGKYFSISPAQVVGDMFIAMAVALCIGIICIAGENKDKESGFAKEKALFCIWVFLPFIVGHMGMRYVFFILGFFILSSAFAKKDPYVYVSLYAILCVLAIPWNVSIGGAFAVGFLPLSLLKIFKEILPSLKDFTKWEKKTRIKRIVFVAVAVISVLLFISPFIKILGFLKENTGETLYVNGNPIFGKDFKFLATFGIFVPIIILIIKECRKKLPDRFIPVILSFAVLVNYACVRYDEGERLLVLAVFYSFYVLITDISEGRDYKPERKNIAKMIPGLLMVCLMFYFSFSMLPFIRPSMNAELIPYSVDVAASADDKEDEDNKEQDRIFYLDGESIGIEALGTGFIRGTTLTSLQNVQTVLLGESSTKTLDLTNRISHVVIFGLDNITPYSSAYNMSTMSMQKRALSYIEDAGPDLILVSPYIIFDQAPLSLRSFYLFTKLQGMGYRPYMYGDCVYLKKGESVFDGSSDGSRMFGLLMHKDELGSLPYLWADACMNMSEEEKSDFEGTFIMLKKAADGSLVVDEDITNAHIPEHMGEMSVITDDVKFELNGNKGAFKFKSEIDGEEHGFNFEIRPDKERYLIPVKSSPFY